MKKGKGKKIGEKINKKNGKIFGKKEEKKMEKKKEKKLGRPQTSGRSVEYNQTTFFFLPKWLQSEIEKCRFPSIL